MPARHVAVRLFAPRSNRLDVVDALDPIAWWRLGEGSGMTADDEENIQDGTYNGTIEFSVESIIEGDPNTSIGLNGSNAYVSVPHNAAFELSSYSIDFAFQADTSPGVGGNRILLSKDIAPSPAGGVSIEVYNDSGTLKLRAYAGGEAGAPTWIGSSSGIAAVQVGVAHKVTLTVDATDGARLYLDGVEVASDPVLSVGWELNTEPIIIGAYSSAATAKFDGVMDEVAVFGVALTAEQIATLPAAKTITHGAPTGNSIPIAAPAGTDFWVAPGGTGNGSSESNPAGSWIDVLQGGGWRAVQAGDIIAVLGGSYFNQRNETVSGVSGTSGSPIQIVGYHPDGQTRPRIDNSHPDFRGGSPSSPLDVWQQSSVGGIDIWETVTTGYGSVMSALQCYGDPQDNELRACGYQGDRGWSDMRSTNLESYCGPGVFKGDGTRGINGRLYISVAPGLFASDSGENFMQITSGSNRNPNEMDLKLIWQDDVMLTLSNCSYLQFYNHEWFYSRRIMRLTGTCTGLLFHYVEHRCGFRGYQLEGTISDCIWQWCHARHNLPVTFSWRDAKSSGHPFAQYNGGTGEWLTEGFSGAVLRDNWWLNCTFQRTFDTFTWLDGDVLGNKYLNCQWLHCRDDQIDHERSVADDEVGYCYFFACFAPFSWRGGEDASRSESQRRTYVHHTIFHCVPTFYGREGSLGGGWTTEPSIYLTNKRAGMSVSTEHSGTEGTPKTRLYYHCTLLFSTSKRGPYIADRLGYRGSPEDKLSASLPSWAMNNIIVAKFDDNVGKDSVDRQIRGGDCLHHISPGTLNAVLIDGLHEYENSWGTKSFTSLSAARADSDVISSSGEWSAIWNNVWGTGSIEADPQLPANATNFVAQPHAAYPMSDYVPANAACASGAINISGFPPKVLWGTAANPTRSYSYEAFRGAVDPSGDGSEIGPQPLTVLPA